MATPHPASPEPTTETKEQVEGDSASDSAEPADGSAPAAPPADEAAPAADDEGAEPSATEPPTTEPADAEPAETSTHEPARVRTGWVTAAFLAFWPLAVPALRAALRTAQANGSGRRDHARRASQQTLDWSLGAVGAGALCLLGLVTAVALAPTYLTPAMVHAAADRVPPVVEAVTGVRIGVPAPAPGNVVAQPAPEDDDRPAAPDDALPDVAAPDEPVPGDDLTVAPDEATAATAPRRPETGGTEIADLAVGDCFDTAGLDDQTVLYTVPVVPCATPHRGEVFAETTVDEGLGRGGLDPDGGPVLEAAHAFCLGEFEEFVGLPYGRSQLEYWPIGPSEQSWADGDRRIACVVESPAAVRGTLRAAAR